MNPNEYQERVKMVQSENREAREIESTGLLRMELPSTRSHIVVGNRGIIYCSVYRNLEGLFCKADEAAMEFGRRICDAVREEANNNGFITSDELPNYGVTRREKRAIYERTEAGPHDLVVIFAYDEEKSQKAKQCLDKLLGQAGALV